MNQDEEEAYPVHELLPSLPVIPTGSLRLDLAIRTGGIPGGQFVEISGAPTSGKTTLCQHIVAQAQQMNRPCAWIDIDQSFNPAYAARCGVILSELIYSNPADAEQAFDILETLTSTPAGMLVVLDSVGALTTRDELSLPLGIKPAPESESLLESRLSLMLRKLGPKINKSQAIVLLTNRARQQRSEAYHQLSTHISRLALRLHAGLRLQLSETGLIRERGAITGQRVQVKILKCKNMPSPLQVEFDIIYNQGINHSGEIFDTAIQAGIIHQEEKSFTFQKVDLGIGRKQAIETLERLSLIQPVEQIIRQKLLRKT
jgi:recombination protein RecA